MLHRCRPLPFLLPLKLIISFLLFLQIFQQICSHDGDDDKVVNNDHNDNDENGSRKRKEQMDVIMEEGGIGGNDNGSSSSDNEFSEAFLAEIDRIVDEHNAKTNKKVKLEEEDVVKIKDEPSDDVRKWFLGSSAPGQQPQFHPGSNTNTGNKTSRGAQHNGPSHHHVGRYYALAQGHRAGIFSDWAECVRNKPHFPGAKCRKFERLQEAEAFVAMHSRLAAETLPTPLKLTEYRTADGVPVVYISVKKGRDPQGQQRTGLGIFWGHEHLQNTGTSMPPGGEHWQRGYYAAALLALRQAVYRHHRLAKLLPPAGLMVKIATDSAIDIKGYQSTWIADALGDWIHGWAQSGWIASSTGRTVQNVDLVKAIYAEMQQIPEHRVRFVAVKDPAGRDFGCIQAKRLAEEGIRGGGDYQQAIRALCQAFDERCQL